MRFSQLFSRLRRKILTLTRDSSEFSSRRIENASDEDQRNGNSIGEAIRVGTLGTWSSAEFYFVGVTFLRFRLHLTSPIFKYQHTLFVESQNLSSPSRVHEWEHTERLQAHQIWFIMCDDHVSPWIFPSITPFDSPTESSLTHRPQLCGREISLTIFYVFWPLW
jgi:hypothetical protein